MIHEGSKRITKRPLGIYQDDHQGTVKIRNVYKRRLD